MYTSNNLQLKTINYHETLNIEASYINMQFVRNLFGKFLMEKTAVNVDT